MSFGQTYRPTTDGMEIIKVIEHHVGEQNICLLSSPPPKPGDCSSSIIGKLAWIEKHLPSYAQERRYLFGKQKEFCSNPDHILIDDYDHNISTFSKAGGRSFLIPRLWNTLHTICANLNVPKALDSYLCSHTQGGSYYG